MFQLRLCCYPGVDWRSSMWRSSGNSLLRSSRFPALCLPDFRRSPLQGGLSATHRCLPTPLRIPWSDSADIHSLPVRPVKPRGPPLWRCFRWWTHLPALLLWFRTVAEDRSLLSLFFLSFFITFLFYFFLCALAQLKKWRRFFI